MKIGYVGLGEMGSELALRLQRHHELLVFDTSVGAVARLTSAGATACTCLADIAARSDVLFLCLPTVQHVRAAVLGNAGLTDGLRPGTMIVDQSTSQPFNMRAVAVDLERWGVEMVDAPVSGSVQQARSGIIRIMVGATSEQFERIRPLLHSMSPHVHHAGEVGAGQVMKLANSLLVGAQRLLTEEVLALTEKNGISPATACEILLAGEAQNSFLETLSASHKLGGKLISHFTLARVHNEMKLACQLGVDSGVPLPFGSATREIYQMCMNTMGATAPLHSSAVFMRYIAGLRGGDTPPASTPATSH
jgi:3-hydroxyisobutyrate dehydrogenase